MRLSVLPGTALLFAGLAGTSAMGSAQTLRFGGVAGTPLTDGIRLLPDWNEIKPISRGLIAGPMLQIGLDSGLGVEINALHRTIGYEYYSLFVDGTRSPWIRANIGTWQFPILVKYTLPRGRIRPLIEAGPSFRASRNKSGTEPSPFGITAGAGAELRFGRLSIAPTVRFTHWGNETWPHRPTVRNQVELLTGIGYDASRLSPGNSPRRVRFGIVAGVPLTGDFQPPRFPQPVFSGTATRTADFRSVAGLMLEARVSDRFAVEVDGLYRRLHFETGPEVVVTWQIPALVKYRILAGKVAPFVQGGPSFRLAGNLNGNNPSHFGATVGGGLDVLAGRVKLAPGLRYTRWQTRDRTKPDQAELVVSVSF